MATKKQTCKPIWCYSNPNRLAFFRIRHSFRPGRLCGTVPPLVARVIFTAAYSEMMDPHDWFQRGSESTRYVSCCFLCLVYYILIFLIGLPRNISLQKCVCICAFQPNVKLQLLIFL